VRLGCEAVVVDIGAGIGLFSIFAALEAQEIKLFSLEPDPSLFEILQFNMADICENAVLLNAGVPAVATLLQAETLPIIDFMRMDIRGYDIGILDTIADAAWRRIRQAVIEIGARRNYLDAVRTLLISKQFNVTVEPHHCGDSEAGYSFFAVRPI
jgi:precorrin-6B methylase 2